MIKIKGLSLEIKLFGAFAIISILLVILSVISISAINSLDGQTKYLMQNEIPLQQKALEINAETLVARHAEDNFLKNNDLKYVDAVTGATASAMKNAGEITQLDISQAQKDQAGRTILLIGDYEKLFLESVQLHKTIGLDETSGLKGEAGKAALATEDLIKKQNNDLLLIDMLQLRQNELFYLLYGDINYLNKMHDREKIFQEDLAAINMPQNVKDEIRAKLLIYTSTFDKIGEINNQIASREKEKSDKINQISSISAEFIHDVEVYKASPNTQAAKDNSNSRNILIILSIITVAASLSMGVIISRSLKRFIGKVQNAVFKVASTAEELSASSEEMKASSEQISTTTQSIASGVGQQSIKMADVSRTMRELSMSVQQVAGNATNAAGGADKAHITAKEVGQKSEDVVRQMIEIRSVVDNSSMVIKQLDGKSKQIGDIIGVITNIADQTNLLALNAAIEAARAGEHGRGFAVVADEVRKLAEGSRNAASQITGLVKEIQQGTKDAVESMEQGTKKVNDGTKTIEDTASVINSVIHSAQDVATMVQEIAAAAEQQASSIEQVTTSIEEVSTISEKSAAGTQETSTATEQQAAAMEQLVTSAQDLTKLAIELQEEVSKFNNSDARSTLSNKKKEEAEIIPSDAKRNCNPKEKSPMNSEENLSPPRQ